MADTEAAPDVLVLIGFAMYMSFIRLVIVLLEKADAYIGKSRPLLVFYQAVLVPLGFISVCLLIAVDSMMYGVLHPVMHVTMDVICTAVSYAYGNRVVHTMCPT
jgi:hypothetical protein